MHTMKDSAALGQRLNIPGQHAIISTEQLNDRTMFVKAVSGLLELNDMLDQLREAATILTLTAPSQAPSPRVI